MRRSYQRLVVRILAIALGLTLMSALVTPEALAQSASAPRLTRVDPPAGAASVRVTGIDPGAPRRLELWRWQDGDFLRLARATSQPGGQFDFGQIALPSEGLDLQVSVRDRAPRKSGRLHIEGRLAAPALSPAAGPDGNRLFIRPARATGLLRVFDARRGTLIHQEPIEVDTRGRLLLDLDQVLAPRPATEILIEQVLPDGRISERGFFRLESPRDES